jgi:rSAM/selenodomain-associated transferase 1
MPLRIAVFCKPPQPGQVKTRLIPRFGAEGAAAIYRQLAERTLANVAEARAVTGAEASLWVAGDLRDHAIADWCGRFALSSHAQQGETLGDRMLHCLQTLCAGGNSALLIGTDCPALSGSDLLAAATALTPLCPWVFSPAEDGGYVLVGSRSPSAVAFDGIAWSTEAVMAQTRAALLAGGQRWAELPMRWDVDEAVDVERAVAAGLVLPPR